MISYFSFISPLKSKRFLNLKIASSDEKICRFLFSSESHRYLNQSGGNTAIASTCLKYLCSDCFDPTLSDDDIRGGIMRGAYVLQEYSASHWLDHVARGLSKDNTSQSLEQLSGDIAAMVEQRKNSRCNEVRTGRVAHSSLKIFEKKTPELYATLVRIHLFLQKRWSEYSLADGKVVKSPTSETCTYGGNGIGDQWINQDPLTISATQLRVHQLFEAALCSTSNHQQDCKSTTIKRYYGLRLFKCNRFGCEFFRIGFESARDRNRHIRAHERPYRCDQVKCEFSQIGFGSQAGLNKHLQHHESKKQNFVAQGELDDKDDMELFLLDAVKNDDTTAVCENISEVDKFATQLTREAARSGSCQMLELLLDACKSLPTNRLNVLPWAVEADNVEAVQLLIDRGTYLMGHKGGMNCMKIAYTNRSPEMIKTLITHTVMMPHNINYYRTQGITLLMTSNYEPELEAKVIRCLDVVEEWADKKYMAYCFKINAKRGCSIAIARFFLQRGVEVNTRGITNRETASTALYEASRQTGQSAAELMKFLLESGADSSLKGSNCKTAIGDMPGPRNVEKWFGITWDQLIEESARVYAASLPAANERDAIPSISDALPELID